VTEIMCNGHEQVFIERHGKITHTDVTFLDDGHLRRVIDKIVGQIGRRIDEASPYVDARLPDGSRVNAVIPPVSIDGPALTIRKFATEAYDAADLVGSAPGRRSRRLPEACVQGRTNILVSGGTGAGKTTTLNVLSSYIPRTNASSRSRTPPSSAWTAPRRPAGVPAAQHRGQGRDHHPRPGPQLPAHAARPDRGR
jgi:pilus assembly protein CpaF